MSHDRKTEDAEALMDATVHWLRHTGISYEVSIMDLQRLATAGYLA